MSNTTYNGWTNYATWRVNLEIFDGITPEDFDLPRGEELKCCDVNELENALKERAEYYIECSSQEGLARDYALAFLSDVNFREIGQHMIDEFSRELA